MLTETVNLVVGVPFEGKMHRAVVIRAAKTRDSFEVEAEAPGKGITYTSVASLVKAIVKFGTVDKNGEFISEIPREKVDVVLLGELYDEDLGRLYDAREYLKKKHNWQRTD
jgi:hypothetical protein